MEIKNLAQTDLSTITDCFIASFADYIIPFEVTEAQLKIRWEAARVDYKNSFGFFVEDHLVGFFITGIDHWEGKLSAFNMATGVLPEYRGQRLVKQLYEHAIPRFREQGIEQCLLEVIIGNDKAIKAYQSVGFEAVRTLHNFSGTLAKSELEVLPPFRFRKTAVPRWKKYEPLQPYPPSWENQAAGIDHKKKSFEFWEFYESDQLRGYFIGDPATGYVPQIGMSPGRWNDLGPFLFGMIAKRLGTVKISNVESSATDLLGLIERRELTNYINQYEMKLML